MALPSALGPGPFLAFFLQKNPQRVTAHYSAAACAPVSSPVLIPRPAFPSLHLHIHEQLISILEWGWASA